MCVHSPGLPTYTFTHTPTEGNSRLALSQRQKNFCERITFYTYSRTPRPRRNIKAGEVIVLDFTKSLIKPSSYIKSRADIMEYPKLINPDAYHTGPGTYAALALGTFACGISHEIGVLAPIDLHQ